MKVRHGMDGMSVLRTAGLVLLIGAVPAAGGGEKAGHTMTNSVGMKLASIPSGSFTMGSPMTEPGRIANETRRQVTFAKGFRIGVTEVTQKQWRQVMGTNPSFFKGEDLPVERITWDEAAAFCRKLSKLENKRYRLPTEAEWEYACRAGSTTAYHSGPDEKALAESGWYVGNSGNRTHPVAGRKPNRWGLHDMHGNVSEWCARRPAGKDKPARQSGQLEREEKTLRDLRGGSWGLTAGDCRSASRMRNAGSYRYFDLGLRVVCELE